MRPGNLELNRSHPLAQGLSFLTLLNGKAGFPTEYATGRDADVFNGAWSYEGITHNTAARCIAWNRALLQTSESDFSGDFTVFVYCAPKAEAQVNALFSMNHVSLGSPVFHFAANKIYNSTGQSSGQLSISVSNNLSVFYGATSNGKINGDLALYAATRKDGVYALYKGGVALGLNASSHGTLSQPGYGASDIGSARPSTSNYWRLNSEIHFAGGHNRALSPAEIAILADRTDPMLGGLVREVSPVSYFDFGASEPADITGTMSVTESGTDTFAATGQLLISGLMSVTETGVDTAAASGTVLIQGNLSATETGSDTFAAYGGAIAPITGTMAVTESDHDTATIIGQLLISGLMDVSEVGDDVFAAIGSALPTITGDMAVSEAGSDIFAALGVVTDTVPITAAEVARIVRATPRIKTVTASARVKQVRYEVTRA